jgi:hypothetical protein
MGDTALEHEKSRFAVENFGAMNGPQGLSIYTLVQFVSPHSLEKINFDVDGTTVSASASRKNYCHVNGKRGPRD